MFLFRLRFLMILLGSLFCLQPWFLTPQPFEIQEPTTAPFQVNAPLSTFASSEFFKLPLDLPADYTTQQFHYVSVQNTQKQWRLRAQKAFFYSDAQLVYAQDIIADLYDAQGHSTHIIGQEALYHTDQKNLEIHGQVLATFSDGFQIRTHYLHYQPEQHFLEIPIDYPLSGQTPQGDSPFFQFQSQGLRYWLDTGQLHLLQSIQADFNTQFNNPQTSTHITSEVCWIDRQRHLAQFRMLTPHFPPSRVKIRQPNLNMKAQKVDLFYGDFTQILDYLIAWGDVLIQETHLDSPTLRYATAGKATFRARGEQRIRLTELPQVYQDQDTVTGDVITFDQDQDRVEVEYSNAYYQQSKSTRRE